MDKALFDSPEFKERVKKRKADRQHVVDNYTPVVWIKFKQKVMAKSFPAEKMQMFLLNNDKKVSVGTGFHWVEKKKHQTTKYSYYEDIAFGLLGIEWSYQYCDECGEITSRHGIALNAIENLATAYNFTNGTPKPHKPSDDFDDYLAGGCGGRGGRN